MSCWVLMPVFNDWDAASRLLGLLHGHLAAAGIPARVVVVDDGSTEPPPSHFQSPAPSASSPGIQHIHVIRLRRNLGHQRAICIGLCWLADRRADPLLHLDPFHLAPVLIMDADGEDDPADAPRLLKCFTRDPDCVVFAERTKRSEGPLFALCYWLFRVTHFLLTGIRVRVGNFSVLPASQLDRLVVVADLWNHYAASVVRARLPAVRVPTQRAHRLAGQSRMNFVSLVTHGLSSMSVFGETIGVRALLACAAAAALVTSALLAVLAIRLFTDWAIPGWATTAGGISLLVLLQLAGIALSFVFALLSARQNASFIPLRDYRWFILQPPEPPR